MPNAPNRHTGWERPSFAGSQLVSDRYRMLRGSGRAAAVGRTVLSRAVEPSVPRSARERLGGATSVGSRTGASTGRRSAAHTARPVRKPRA